jgi:glycosyltransferase involved in cell wall biosynthesis
MPKRILQLIPTLGHGGAERQLAYLCRGLTDLGWQVHVASLSEGLFRDRFIAGGAILHGIPARGHRDPAILTKVVRLIREVEPRLIQSWIPMMDVVGGMAARATGVPWILTERTALDARPSDLKKLRTHVRARLGRRAAAVISNSSGGDRYWGHILPDSVPRFVIPNALPLDEIDAARAADPSLVGLSPDAPLLLSVGRFDEGKNVMGVIDAFERATAQSSAVGLILGDGALSEQAKRRVAAGGLGARIAMPGVADRIFSWLKRARVLVSLSRYEGMPNVVMEAMAAECPLVVSDIPAHRDLLDDRCALWVSPEDPGAAAEAIHAVLRDPDSARRRSKFARERTLGWTIRELASAHERIYERIAPSRAPAIGTPTNGLLLNG